MNIKDIVLHCIETEDKRNPYTDEKIADILDLSRENVTNARKELKIPDSRERRKSILNKAITDILRENPNISDRSLTKLLNERHFVIGKYAVAQLKKQMQVEEQPDNILIHFSDMLGCQQSLKNEINRAIAAMIYPPYGLHCLVTGPYGSGKSTMVEHMITFAKTLPQFENAPVYQMNCSEYKDDGKELLRILFGSHEEKETVGILEKESFGFIHLMNLEDFPIQGKELLFRYLNRGQFARLNDNKKILTSHVLIIGSLSLGVDEMHRNFPMMIRLPAFHERPMKERIEFINKCFGLESRHLGSDLTVKKEVMRALVMYQYSENLKQIASEIKVICAKSFLDKKINGNTDILITYMNLPESIKSSVQYIVDNKECRAFIRGDQVYVSSSESSYSRSDMNESWDIYHGLESRFEELKAKGMSDQEANDKLIEEIEYSLSKQIRNVEESKMSEEEVSVIVGKDILELSQSIYNTAKHDLPYLSDRIIFPLAIHLKMLIERQRSTPKVRLSNEVNKIKNESPKEYIIAKNILGNISKKYNIPFIEEEMSFLAIYFQKFQNRFVDDTKRIAVLVVSHGHVASAMAEIANVIMGEQHAVGLDLEYSDSPKVMSDKLLAKVHEIDQGKGCIILADMGSLLQVREKVERELGIHVGVLGRTDTLMVIECIRKTLWTNESIDEIIQSIDIKETRETYENQNRLQERPKAILTCCITGEGAAIQLENYLKPRFESVFKNITWLHVGYIDETEIKRTIDDLCLQYDIMACVGTLNPQLIDIPFFSSNEVYTKEGLTRLKKYCSEFADIYNPLDDVLDIDCIHIINGIHTKEEIIDDAVQRMIDHHKVNEKYLLSVYKREAWLPTYLQGNIAIPHGESEFVTKSVIHITKLDKPVCWDGENFVNYVFMIALKEDDTEAFQELYNYIKEPSFLKILQLCKTSEDILEKFHGSNTVLDS